MIHAPIVAVIGTGNMGTGLISGLVNSGHPPERLWGTCPNKDKLEYLHRCFHIHTSTNNSQASQAADFIIFAIKPQIFQQVAIELTSIIQTRRPLIISIAAGTREKNIQQWVGGAIPIVRAMPNTPALIGAGATALYANHYVKKKQLDIAESILRSVGIVVWLKQEMLLDSVTAVSGSGPAYFFLVMEVLQNVAVKLGLPEEIASLLVKETALGAARMAIESDHSLAELRRKVTSPGGTTEKAISVLEEKHVREIFAEAIRAAAKRSEELG